MMKTVQRLTLNRGFTLVELLAALAVTAVVLGTVLPDFARLVQRQRLEGAAAQLETEMQFARSLAVAQGRSVRFSFGSNEARSCYVIHTGSASGCSCESGATVCAAGSEAIRTVQHEAIDGLRVTSNSRSFLFDTSRGTVTPTATVRLENRSGDELRLVVSIMGRVRDCTPTGLRGHRAC